MNVNVKMEMLYRWLEEQNRKRPFLVVVGLGIAGAALLMLLTTLAVMGYQSFGPHLFGWLLVIAVACGAIYGIGCGMKTILNLNGRKRW